MENVSNQFKTALSKEFKKSAANAITGKNPLPIESYGKMMTSLSSAQKEVKEDDYDEFFEEISKEETKEATGAGSAGGFESPLFSEPKKNTLFQPGTESKLTKPKGGPVTEDKIPGGLTDGMTLEDLADYHNTSIDVLIDKVSEGVNTEMEHTSDMSIALEIAMDHIYEDLDYYSKLEKIEATEATTSASVGAYDAPFGGPKKDPLKLSNPDTVYKELRSVKDKNFPKLGGPGSTYVKVKDKCKKFPYCNQGDIKALEFFENNLVKEAINNISNRFKLNEDYIKGVILENTNIYYKNTDMNKDIENMIDGIVEKVLSEEINKKAKQITESVTEEIDEMQEFYEIAKQRKEERMEAKNSKPDFLDLDGDGDKKESMKKAAKDKEETKEGAKPDFLDLDGDGDKEESMKKASKDKEETKESLKLSEEEMIDLIEKIINEEKIEGIKTQDSAMKQSKKDTDSYMKDFMKKMKDYLKDSSKGTFDSEPKHFPKGNGELEKMEKKAYTPSDSVEEYIDQIARSGGMENLEYDQIKPDEEWLDKNILGSSETGNSDEYANAVPTDVNKSVKKRKDLNILNKLKKQSYEKAPQPVFDVAGEKTHGDIMDLGESKEDKKQNKINEDLDRIKKLFSHDYKTQ
jgi:hypothetical protein